MIALVAYDGSPCAQRALAAAGELLENAAVVVCHVGATPVVPPTDLGLATMTPPSAAEVPESLDAAHAASARVVEGGVATAEAAGLRARPVVIMAAGGKAVADAIVNAAEEHDADLIVVGSHGHSTVRTALLGSVSRDILSRTQHPVLVVPASD